MTSSLRTQHAVRGLVHRLLDTPDLAERVRALPTTQLAAWIERVGLEDAGELLALVDAEQLGQLFEQDVWRAAEPGTDELFDVERFAIWLEVLLEGGTRGAAERLAEQPEEFLKLAFSRLILVLERDWLVSLMDDDEDGGLIDKSLASSLSEDVGDYVVLSKKDDAWDATLAVLLELDEQHGALLGRLLGSLAFAQTSAIDDANDLHEVLSDLQVLEEDAAAAREESRAARGFIAPAEARAFLRLARTTAPDQPDTDAVTRAYFRRLSRAPQPEARGLDPSWATELDRDVPQAKPLRSAEVVAPRLRVLLSSSEGTVREQALESLAYLTNVLLAGDDSRELPWRPSEAADEALRLCEHGLERLAPGGDADVARDQERLLEWGLVGLFRKGVGP